MKFIYRNTWVSEFWGENKTQHNTKAIVQDCFSSKVHSVYKHYFHDLCAFKILLANTLSRESLCSVIPSDRCTKSSNLTQVC
jgi:hypothetical protein